MMTKKKTEKTSNAIRSTLELFEDGDYDPSVRSGLGKVPSIEEFIYGKDWLGFGPDGNGIELRMVQMLALKVFYRGSPGNEDLQLTEEELDFCKEYLNSDENGNFIEKWDSGEIFNELVLVWGRRSGKDFTSAFIALYEAMKLIEMTGGDPYNFYNLDRSAPFSIVTIANNADQAGIAFSEIASKIKGSPYFEGRIGGILDRDIYIQTPSDQKRNSEAHEKDLPITRGTIVIKAGHSSSKGLVGKGCYVLVLDEVGLMPPSGTKSGTQIYNDMKPTLKTFYRKVPQYNDDGTPVMEKGKHKTKTEYDGKLICISTPRGQNGIFWDVYRTASEAPRRLMMRLPTWIVNDAHTEQSLRADELQMDDEKFMMEYGAQFSGTAGENFFPPEYVDWCFEPPEGEKPLKFLNVGKPGICYFAHLDPAVSSNNYALAIVHRESHVNKDRRPDFRIILDYLEVWKPQSGVPIDPSIVDHRVLELNRKFHLGLVTFDNMLGQASIIRLSKAGIPMRKTHFSHRYKFRIYTELHTLVTQKKLKMPYHRLLRDEMLNLQKRYIGNTFRVFHKNDGEVQSDDCADALAGAVFNAIRTDVDSYPTSRSVYMPQSGGIGNQTFTSMQGIPYGMRNQMSGIYKKTGHL